MGGTTVGHHLEATTVEVCGRPATYSVGGSGFPVVFLHGWGLADHSYRRSLKRLVMQGCRVYAPTMPGFGDTAELPPKERTLAGYAAWVDAFMEAVGICESALVIGHSFGGGVSTVLAHDHPTRVRYLVLLNSVGAPSVQPGGWSAPSRSGWLWALRAMRDPIPLSESVQVLRSAAEDLVPNIFRHPRTMVEIGILARTADLSVELVELAKRDVPILVLWGDHDRVLPVGSFESLCRAVGSEGKVVKGNHSWLLADPDTFGEVMSNVVEVAARDGATEIATLLDHTSVPGDVVDRLMAGAAPLWLMSEPPATLASDLALCHPPLLRGEIRAVAFECESADQFRLTVVAHDRHGLLADTTAVLAAEGLSVVRASATTWTKDGIAMHSLVVDAPDDFLVDSWDLLAKRLRSVAEHDDRGFLFEPGGRAAVRATPQAFGRSMLSISAPDRLGLLWTICSWLADRAVTIEAMHVTSIDGMAHDEFIVKGAFDVAALADHLSSDDTPMWQKAPVALVSSAVRAIRSRVGVG